MNVNWLKLLLWTSKTRKALIVRPACIYLFTDRPGKGFTSLPNQSLTTRRGKEKKEEEKRKERKGEGKVAKERESQATLESQKLKIEMKRVELKKLKADKRSI